MIESVTRGDACVVKNMIVAGLMLTLSVAGFVACGTSGREHTESGMPSSAIVATSSQETQSTPDDVIGEYLSEAGDGEILKLKSDGTFVSYTMTDMCSDACAITMFEIVTGTYIEKQDGMCTLTVVDFEVKVEGMEDHPEEIEAYVDLLAGADGELRDMYERLFGGETIEGREFCGEEEFDKLLSAEIVAVLDFENGTFAYHSTAE